MRLKLVISGDLRLKLLRVLKAIEIPIFNFELSAVCFWVDQEISLLHAPLYAKKLFRNNSKS